MDQHHEKNGILVPRLSPESWEKLAHFTLRSRDVFIAAYPKSGTTWVSQIVKLLQTDGKGDGAILWESILWLESIESSFCHIKSTLEDIEKMQSPRIFKSHFPYDIVPGGLPHKTQAKYIYVMRNPKDACVSRWYYHNMTNHHRTQPVLWEEHFDQWISGEVRYGSWFNHILGWWANKEAGNILFIKYEDMIVDLSTAVRSIAEFIGIQNVTEELLETVREKSTFTSMKKDDTCNVSWACGKDKYLAEDAEFIRKGKIGDWVTHFTEEQNTRFDAMFAKKMAGVDLTFQFV